MNTLFDYTVDQQQVDSRTDRQEGKKVSYDVGKKVGGARKDEFALKQQFLETRSQQDLMMLEGESVEAAADLITKSVLFEDFSLEKEKENNVEPHVARFKQLLIQRIDKVSKDSEKGRACYLKASQYVLQQLKDVQNEEELKDCIRDFNSLVIYDGYSTDYLRNKIEELKIDREKAINKEITDFSPEHFERLIESNVESLEKMNRANHYRLTALGESFKNLFSKQGSLNSTLKNSKKVTSWDELLKKKVKKTSKRKGPVWARQLPNNPERQGGIISNISRPDELRFQFGFSGVEFGHYVNDQEAMNHIIGCSEALFDLYSIMGLKDFKSLSLDKKLSLAFGARGRGKALGTYEPMYRVINFTKEKGTL